MPPTEEVYLWLGVTPPFKQPQEYYAEIYIQANVMLSYPIPEAETLLEGKLAAARSNLDNCQEDMDFLREQITVRG